MLNSLLHELTYRRDGLQLLGELLGEVWFPCRKQISQMEPVRNAEVIVEQSLSDFGDSDCVILLDRDGHGQTAFVEAKVATSQVPSRYFRREFDFFRNDVGRNGRLGADLFSQLYRKLVLASALVDRGFDQVVAKGIEVENGKEYRNSTVRKLGRNPVVLRAARKMAVHLSDVLLVAVVPLGKLDPEDAAEFAASARMLLVENECVGVDLGLCLWKDFLRSFGLLTWLQVEGFCMEHHLDNTMVSFRHNAGQISAHLKSNSVV
ncbi:hypothetical protein FJY68_12725 [candidate division WOR-3 bacterium]|uniref:Uncharacterized protein n=1 Tax=candidate division WOR-3 bacterium TaxID=2052148 RepID=A0A937XFX8_UNCW3|nr:hypothetical protein [candidate division WOR-3 bacterium]